MILSPAFFEALKVGDTIEAALVGHPKEKVIRSPSFFPVRYPRQKMNPKYSDSFDKKTRMYMELPYITEFPTTQGWSANDYVKGTGFCCGSAEISSSMYPQYCVMEQTEFLKNLGIPNESGKEAAVADHLAHAAGSYGLFIYNYALDRYGVPYQHFANLLKKFGFSKLLSFANPNHGGHEVEMLACHTVKAHVYVAGRPEWLDSSITRVAKIAAAETTSVSTTTGANSASAAIGSSARHPKAA